MSNQSPKKTKWYRLSQTPPADFAPTTSTLPTFATGSTTTTTTTAPRRHEPARTTKTAPKTVIFPPGSADFPNTPDPSETEESATHGLLPEVSPAMGHMGYDDSDSKGGEKLRRVSAWLAADSFDIRAIQDHFLSLKGQSSVEPKRFDEVLYTPYSFMLPASPTSSKQATAEQVASTFPIGELFVFEYGAVVIWGLEEAHERAIIKQLSPWGTIRKPIPLSTPDTDEMELEQFHFFHDNNRPPRLYNDTISLRSGSRLVKLAISHALAQSVKLTRFEAVVESTIAATKDIPYTLASTGSIAMSRREITRQIGELLITRINVNLVSNVLDTPEIFWSEPAYEPLYQTVRRYLEISQRVDLLNQRCSVISDMLDLLRDHANSMHAEYLEWIIIVLITIEILLGLIEIGMGGRALLPHLTQCEVCL
jgi:uncharacterized Rmd1/YagE family protein